MANLHGGKIMCHIFLVDKSTFTKMTNLHLQKTTIHGNDKSTLISHKMTIRDL